MRRVLRSIAANRFDQLGDVSTLAEPTIVNGLIEEHEKILEEKAKKVWFYILVSFELIFMKYD